MGSHGMVPDRVQDAFFKPEISYLSDIKMSVSSAFLNIHGITGGTALRDSWMMQERKITRFFPKITVPI